MAIESVGTSDGNNYNIIPKTMGSEMVCLKSMVEQTTQRNGDFIVPDAIQRNDRTLYFEVVNIGDKVTELSDIRIGDYVFVDALARYADTAPISFINCRNILFKTDSFGKSLIARKGRIIVEAVYPVNDTVNGFLTLNNIDPYGIIISIGADCKDRGYSVGDRITLSGNGDVYDFAGKRYFDYDYRVPMAKFAD